ncbi:alpha-1,4-glucan--maltose-1-phosphate maltosyltransferase [Glaciibacter psychrotolerans]|uniref:Alpha-1,4-glucan:maltose-1-phosphate maltosyltransferase n=1 Tax=Glaciibacter psychrotolerans TaxID=670054 RepID=A0A7Z0ED15_9MICO|nr:starch synthase (maltosyl-transferring) [Leifsonia psychrotolerans]
MTPRAEKQSAGPGIGRIPILDLSPQLNDNRWPAKAFVGEVVPFRATAFREGHDLIGVTLLLISPNETETSHPMRLVAPGTDRYEALVQVTAQGCWRYRVRAYSDDFATWVHTARIKIPADLDVELTFALGAELARRAAAEPARSAADKRRFTAAARTFLDTAVPAAERLALVDDPALQAALAVHPLTSLASESESRRVVVERTRAGVGSWYEFFPRSEGARKAPDGSWTSGTFRTAAPRLADVAAMGFDVVYLPPIHPIGHAFRKGPNNTLTAGPFDPGSPWAIGSSAGGHDAVHPDLGTLDDFRFFVAQAAASGIDIALDFALQASPDHPWVYEHPEWFTTLPDGSIAYAENPPKKYQDIYPINFDNDPVGIRAEALRVLRHWIGTGVSIFRVDNPHTKPLDFWEWLIATVNAEFPDVVFLAEAFTRPALLQALAQVGFQQSYTYFTWRNTKAELEEFFDSLAHETADYLRPNLFVNTPDILTEYLQFGGPAAFKIRAALAATAAPSWGVYAGFELFESVARAGAEENIDSEKYEYRPRSFARAEAAGTSLAPFLTLLNRIRAEHPALRQLRNLHIHDSDDSGILVYSKFLDARFTGTGQHDAVIVVANVDPHSVRQSVVHLDVSRFGIAPGEAYDVHDLITGSIWTWSGDNYVRLDAFTEPVHILHVLPSRHGVRP